MGIALESGSCARSVVRQPSRRYTRTPIAGEAVPNPFALSLFA
jgi:hypothetical protein